MIAINLMSISKYSTRDRLILFSDTHGSVMSFVVCCKTTHKTSAWEDPEGVGTGGSGPPEKKHKNLGILSNNGSDPLKITKLPT